MPVSTFLAKANALKSKGALAVFSGDLKLLKAEVNNSAKAYGNDVKAARKAGKLTHSCPPAGTKLSMNSDELLGYFNSIPPAQRNMSVKTAFYGLMKKKFPCPA
ncbi:MAG TPA: hypothetical protein VK391_03545 [Allosphingosinicella sp.]|nr:hypothetical protein [Allosphingosinicella sp.]